MIHITVMFVYTYILLLRAQRCCHLIVGEAPSRIQESLSSKQYYQEDGIKSENKKTRT
jgi:hypothetical protein